MSKINHEPPNPPNLLPPIDKSNEFTKTHKKPEKKLNKSLKAKKTTRTMNHKPKVVMKHGMKDRFDVKDSIKARDDVTEDGLIFEEGLEEKEVRDTLGKKDGNLKGVFSNEANSNVSAMFLELISVNLSKNSYDSGIIFDGMPEMPPLVELNSILNLSFNLASGANGDLLGNLVSTVWGNNNVGNERNSRNKTGMSSGVKDFKMKENNSFKKAASFSNVVQGTSFVGDNKLNLVPCNIKEDRKVVDMDPIIEEEDGLQNVIENEPWLVDQNPLFVQRWVARICLDKPEPARIPLWVKIYNVPFEAWNVEGINKIASRIKTPIIIDKVTTFICERGYGRASFAMVLIKVDAAKGIVDNVEICNVQVNNGKRYVLVKNMAKEKTSDMKGETLEFYEARIAEDGQDGNKDYKIMKFGCAVEDELGEGLSAHADFMTKNMVSNTVDASMTDMDQVSIDVFYFPLLTKLCILRSSFSMRRGVFFISFIYGENELRVRLKLWDNLSEHMGLVNSRPWTMLEDFNVIMNAYEHSKGVADVYKCVREFRGCMEQLDMENLAMNGMFFTWVQKLKDLNKGILKKLDKVMGNSGFLDLFSSCYARFLPYVTSDHCLTLLVITDVTKKKRRAFRFMNYLTEKKEFYKLVNDKWNKPI
uniref:Uncharacterized protein n=1 Tax=Tanacetum cinerariifolium TaxID=118510 RepID=A0A6L2P5Q8_TANCI|nr:hypothetical protein [Tanacetum cinerariifolium]